MSLSRLQNGLQDIYELDIAHNVDDFLITSKVLAERLESNRHSTGAKEKLLVHEDEEGLNLSLFIDKNVLNRFARHDPFKHLDHRNMEAFCLALEGISHFIYLVWNAGHDRSVTLLEMELQAEVDKFIMLMNCLDEQSNLPPPGRLIQVLFENSRYREDLSREELQRYREANFHARKYCKSLENRFLRNGNKRGLLGELRRFYRLRKRDKLERISRLH